MISIYVSSTTVPADSEVLIGVKLLQSPILPKTLDATTFILNISNPPSDYFSFKMV